MMPKPTVATMAQEIAKNKARIRFASTGECDHETQYEEFVEPYGCNKIIIQCGVCNKIKQELYK